MSSLLQLNDTAISNLEEAYTGERASPKEKSSHEPADNYFTAQSDYNGMDGYLQAIGRTPLLTIKEEVELARRIRKGDNAARQHMIRANLRLVVKIAGDYSHFGLPLQDLISEGNMGLMKAVERFDPAKGGKLSTYAAWWIKQYMKRALANQSKTIRLPVHLIDKISHMRRTAARLQDKLGRNCTNDELADELGMPAYKVAHLQSVSVRPSSLDAPVSAEDNTEVGDLICDENAPTPFENLNCKSVQQNLSALVDELDAREAKILRLRFGLDGEPPRTLEEVGAELHITRERVRQLQMSALSSMRKKMLQLEHQRTVEEVKEEEQARQRLQMLRGFILDHGQVA